MTKEQAVRLDKAIAEAGLNWWEVQEKIGAENLTNNEAIETAIEVIEKMAKQETTVKRKCYTEEDAEKVAMIYVRGTDANQQFEECKEYAEARGYDVVGVVYDCENELFREIGNIDVLVVAGQHRIASDAEEYYSIEAALAEDGILIEIA